MKFRRRGKRPAFDAVAHNQSADLIGEFLIDPAVRFGLELRALRDAVHVAPAPGISHRKSTCSIGYFVYHFAMGICDIECLNQRETRTAGWRFIYPIGF